MNVRIGVPGRRDRGSVARGGRFRAERVGGEGRLAIPTAGERDERSDYWLRHCEEFEVSGPDGRIGSVALVLSSGEGVDGLVVRTGLFRARTVFVPLDEVGSVTPRRRRVELLITPDASRAPRSHILRELLSPGASESPDATDTRFVGSTRPDRR